ncbi:MAG: hypothetical protein J6D08_09785 [Lachnospiraceae bacterium]|nr:hypothetical protein [Lachnospiraceae bacterium]
MLTEDEFLKEQIRREAEYDSISCYVEKNKRIKKEIARLKKLFKEIDENKKKLVQSTIEDVAFLAVTMQDLRESIVRDGTTVEYKNGENQYGTKQSPDAQLYLAMSQKQTQAMKILIDCMPKSTQVPMQNDGFDDFVRGRDTS